MCPLNASTTSITRSVFVVDDDPVVLQLVGLCLHRAEMTVCSFQSAEEALDALDAGVTPALAIIDISLPGLSGLDLAERLASKYGISFMMMTADGNAAAVTHAVSIGALGYLVKPLDMAQLIPTVTAGLARSEEILRLRKEALRLEDALHGDRTVSVAIGMLMAASGISEQEAFNQLRREARALRKPLDLHAKEITAGRTRRGDNSTSQ